jgi:hypothetical protein
MTSRSRDIGANIGNPTPRTIHLPCSLFVLALVLVANAVPFFKYRSGDADFYLIPWYQHILAVGRVQAFAEPFSNYSPPYLYLLSAASALDPWVEPLVVTKLLACLGAIWMAYAIARLLQSLGSRFAVEAAIASLLLPAVILNVSLLGQADIFWVAPCILGLIAAIEGRLGRVAFWSGVAFAFKLQAAFLAPFVLTLFLARRAPWWCWLTPVIVYLAAMVPAWLAGWPASNLLTIYVRQAVWQPEHGRIFVSNAASWWTIYGAFFPRLALKTFWVGYAVAAAAVAEYVRRLRKRVLSPSAMVAAAALGAAGLPFLLPGMHERFTILADVLTYCLAFGQRSPRTIAAAVLMQVASALPGYAWAFQNGLFELPACFFALGAIALLIEFLGEGRECVRGRSRKA